MTVSTSSRTVTRMGRFGLQFPCGFKWRNLTEFRRCRRLRARSPERGFWWLVTYRSRSRAGQRSGWWYGHNRRYVQPSGQPAVVEKEPYLQASGSVAERVDQSVGAIEHPAAGVDLRHSPHSCTRIVSFLPTVRAPVRIIGRRF